MAFMNGLAPNIQSADDLGVNDRNSDPSTSSNPTGNRNTQSSLAPKLIDFAFSIAKLLQSATVSDIIFFNNEESKLIFNEFATSTVASSIFIIKTVSSAGNSNSDQGDEQGSNDSHKEEPQTQFNIVTQLTPIKNVVSTIVLMKEKGKLLASGPLDSQIQVLNLPSNKRLLSAQSQDKEAGSREDDASEDSSLNNRKAFEMLKTLVSLGISPYFEAITQQESLADTATDRLVNKRNDLHDQGHDNMESNAHNELEYRNMDEKRNNAAILATKKKFSELSLSLQHILQSVQVPDLLLSVHPIIRQAVEKAKVDGKDPISYIPAEYLSDPVFLNQLQSVVNQWVKAAQEVSKLTRDTIDGPVLDEINFWSSIETALLSVQDQLNSQEVESTLAVLRNAKRFYATVSLLSDTGLKEALLVANKYNQLLRDLPVDELLSATSFKKVEESIIIIMSHMKKLRVTSYPISRALQLVESVSFDIDVRMKYLINQARLVELGYSEFLQQMEEISSVYITLDKQIKEFTNLARELLRKRSEKFIFVKISPKTVALRSRLQDLYNFRQKHYETVVALVNIISPSENAEKDYFLKPSSYAVKKLIEQNPVEEMDYAYEAIKGFNIAETNTEGQKKWQSAEKVYNVRAQKVENSVILMLREILLKARTSNEIFAIFKKFSLLLSKPSISSSVQEYQNKLLDITKSDISNLQIHFVKQKETRLLYEKNDFQKISSTIIWAKQIESKLKQITKRLETVLGPNWSDYADGQKIYSEIAVFSKKIDANHIYNMWLREAAKNSASVAVQEEILKIASHPDGSKKGYTITVNFELEWMVLFKEVRNLCNLNYQVPHQIISTSRTIRRIYPFVISLNDTVALLYKLLRLFQRLNEFSALIMEDKFYVLRLLKDCFSIKWDDLAKAYDFQNMNNKLRQTSAARNRTSLIAGQSDTANANTNPSGPSIDEDALIDNKLLKLIESLESSVVKLQAKIDGLSSYKVKLSQLLLDLVSCEFLYSSFEKILQNIQEIVNSIILENYGNVNIVVTRINKKIEKIFAERLKRRLDAITSGELIDFLPESKHEIILSNITVCVIPQVENAKFLWINAVQNLTNVVRKQQKISLGKFELSVEGQIAKENSRLNAANGEQQSISRSKQTFSGIEKYVQYNLMVLYDQIKDQFKAAEKYANSWRRFQALWDLQAESVYKFLNKDIKLWINVLNDIRQSRRIFDTVESSKKIGCAVFQYKQIQLRVNAEYDSWQKQILSSFSDLLGNTMKQLDLHLVNSRSYLEAANINVSSTSETIKLISRAHTFKDSLAEWRSQIELFNIGQTLLVRNRFPFPSDWLHAEQVEDDFKALSAILSKRLSQIASETAVIVKRIESELAKVSQSMKALKQDWNTKKPVAGTLVPSAALNILKLFEQKAESLQEQKSLLNTAARVLLLPMSLTEDLTSIVEEVNDYKSVWSSIEILHNLVQDIRHTLWSDVVPRTIRKELDNVLVTSRSMPTKVRQYSAFELHQGIVKQLLKETTIISDLCSGAMKERHWKKLYRALSKEYVPLHSLRLGDVWDLHLSLNEAIVKTILTQANGEKVLEDSLTKIKDTWGNITFDLFAYQNKGRLVRGWDSLFKQCTEDLDVLSTMKHSAFFSIFELEATTWENNLNKLYVLLDVWIDVQRQWIYLDGVFGDNRDIKRLLPVESSRFESITLEFFRLLKVIYKSPFVIDAIGVENVHNSMEKNLDILARVRKALGDYLEKQRELFPRFYFIGNDDLLNIIGNSDNPKYIGNHLGKIFANISGIEYDGTRITAVYSKEHETVTLLNPLVISKFGSLIEWLKELDFELKQTLATLTEKATVSFVEIVKSGSLNLDSFLSWIRSYPCQTTLLAIQVSWTQVVEAAIEKADFTELKENFSVLLGLASSLTMEKLAVVERSQVETLLIELVHEYNVILELSKKQVSSLSDFLWSSKTKYYLKQGSKDYFDKITVNIVDTIHNYGFEYQGLTPSLVKNKVIESLFVDYSETLTSKKGGCSFGPAGTGKTESVKEFGKALGRLVLVFNCDESFDFTAISRILLGVCQIGSFVCFDEFNRLDLKMLSSVSSQIEKIELALSRNASKVNLLGTTTNLNQNTSIFITMNPTYAGRSTLPENLKKLFRSFSVKETDKEVIAEVILFSQGFDEAKDIAKKIVVLFSKLSKQLSKQLHYDFGLRALKSTVNYCGRLRRESLAEDQKSAVYEGIYSTITPKLVENDVNLFEDILAHSFGTDYSINKNERLLSTIEETLTELGLPVISDFVKKVIQLYLLSLNHHGIMIVGDSGCGKTTIREVLLKALQKYDSVESTSFVINPKVSKEALYGSLDLTTREFKDGLFTSFLRRIVTNLRGELSKRIWIVFDGDVDPEWVENLNSLLDDNKIFTLPNGEHIALPENVKVVFETDSLKHATPATVSRCGMVWVSSNMVGPADVLRLLVNNFETFTLASEEALFAHTKFVEDTYIGTITEKLLADHSEALQKLIDKSISLKHVFKFIVNEKLDMMLSIYRSTIKRLIAAFSENKNFFDEDTIRMSSQKALLFAIFWSFSGDCSSEEQESFSLFVNELLTEKQELLPLLDKTISIPDMNWTSWSSLVPSVDSAFQDVNQQLIIPTVDTVRLKAFVNLFAEENKFLILCGPPGSGKTMTVLDCLRGSNRELISINFSGKSTIKDLLSVLHQYCAYARSSNGVSLKPKSNKEVVCFIDEINLPALDRFGSQSLISFLRDLVEQGGFYSKDNVFVKLENVKFVGACNPSSDLGRNELSPRFLRHCSVLFVDYPSSESLTAIYNVFAVKTFAHHDNLSGFSPQVVSSIISIYYKLKEKVPVLSPRDLTRFMRSLSHGLGSDDYMSLDDFLRLYLNEALRLFSDRISDGEIKNWIFNLIQSTLSDFFNIHDSKRVFQQPILYSSWLSTSYSPVNLDDFRNFVSERLRVFSNEVLDAPLILYQDCLDHIARMDRVLSLPQGHLILVGASTSGKTTLCRFVSWINGLHVVQLAVHKNYGLKEFDATLKDLLRRSGALGEQICFIIDESNILESSFVERMNTLLANSEVPSLFSGSEFADLMTLCMEQSQQQGLLLDTDEELYKWFTQQVSENLHVVFTINSPDDSSGPQILSSPALLNRCVVNWMGDWSDETLEEVASELIRPIPVDNRQTTVQTLIDIHRSIVRSEDLLAPETVPGHFLEFLNNFLKTYKKKEEELEAHQRHINVGLDKLRDTVLQVKDLKDELSAKQAELKRKDKEAKEMLDKMLVDQNEAERKQEASLEVKNALKVQEVEIQERKTIVNSNLEDMLPVIEAAAQNVKNIKKQNLSELRSMNNPPDAVKLTLEAVCILLGYGFKATWREIQGITRRDDFILSILNFENNIGVELRDYLNQNYFSKPNFNLSAVSRASKACGPLLAWIEAQVKYAAVLEQVEPLQNEVFELEASTKENKIKLMAISQMIEDLESSIEQYKENYSVLIRETENIKTQMQAVEKKVHRSLALMDSLTQERNRWSQVSFKIESLHLPGNSIISAAFLTYSGYYDQTSRSNMLKKWKQLLSDKDIRLDENLTIKDFLSNSNETLEWQEKGLLNDDLFTENMILIKHSNKVPFLIDPSGQMIEVLNNIIEPRKLIVASFLDKGFVKQVENALRFGGSILVEDADYYDPVISSILKGEFSNIGGRFLIKLGGQEVDCSPNFKLYLHTKNPLTKIPSHIAGRTTIVNFTTTKSSLENKVLNLALLQKEPEVEQRRQKLIKLNGEYKAHLRKLEEKLLLSLSNTRGNILNNDELVTTLEHIKAESKEIEDKMEETASIMKTVEAISEKYQPLASHSSGIFAALSSMEKISGFYQFSLEYFFDIFNSVLSITSENNITVATLIRYLYKQVIFRTMLRLRQQDRATLGMSLYMIYLQSAVSYNAFEASQTTVKSLYGDTPQDALKKCLIALGVEYGDLDRSSENFEQSFASLLENVTPVQKDELLSLKLLVSVVWGEKPNPGKLTLVLTSIYDTNFGIDSNSFSESQSLRDVFTIHTASKTPIILSSSEGFDPSFKVQQIAQATNTGLSMVAMGSTEAVSIANQEIAKAAKDGYWVLIQNCQMASSWLDFLTRHLESFTSSKNFRLILTCNLSSDIPVTLLRSSYVLVFEKPPGLKSGLSEAINSVSPSRFKSTPAERKHIYFLLAWYHAVIQERSRLVPVGWKSNHDFNNTDFEFCLNIIDRVIDKAANGRMNISPDNIPWEKLQYLIGKLAYGGKVDNDDDYNDLLRLTKALFNPKAFDIDFNLLDNPVATSNNQVLAPPEERSFEAYKAWVSELPMLQPYSWIGLHEDVELVVGETSGKEIAKRVTQVIDTLNEF